MEPIPNGEVPAAHVGGSQPTIGSRIYWGIIFPIHLMCVIILGISLVYMYFSVQASFEYETEEDFYPLEHFPGFRIVFTIFVLNVILSSIIILREKNAISRVISTLILILLNGFLTYAVDIYQHFHDPFWGKSGTPIHILVVFYYLVIFCLTCFGIYLLTKRIKKLRA